MTYRWTVIRARTRPVSMLAAASLAVATGCTERSGSPTSNARFARPAAGIEQATAGDQLGHLRAATARFQNIEVARDAGYTIELTGCMENASLGGMGYHFGKGSAINNPTPDPLEPEALLYEPQGNGRYRLVGLEFIIPYTLLPRSSTPPTLFGQQFKQNDVFQVWALHAWIWRNNPSGIFADWNPTVDCAAAPTAARMSHGGH